MIIYNLYSFRSDVRLSATFLETRQQPRFIVSFKNPTRGSSPTLSSRGSSSTLNSRGSSSTLSFLMIDDLLIDVTEFSQPSCIVFCEVLDCDL